MLAAPSLWKLFCLLAYSCAESRDKTSSLIKQHDNKQLLSINLFVLERGNTPSLWVTSYCEGMLVKKRTWSWCLIWCRVGNSTYVFKLLNKLANLLDHLGHKDDVHLVWEVAGLLCADQQALSPGHHNALVQRHLAGRYRERELVCIWLEMVRAKGNSEEWISVETLRKKRQRMRLQGRK